MICATRTLRLATGSNEVDVVVTVDTPCEDEDAWACQCAIAWPSGLKEWTAHGSDSVQALYNALQMLAIRLYASPEQSSGQLKWAEDGGYGFPLPKAARSDLKGYDAEFFG